MKRLIMLVGPPGSGKTTLRDKLVDFFKYTGLYFVNQDTQGKKCFEEIYKPLLAAEKDIIIDRMNFNKEQRERYLKPAKEAGYKTKIIVLHESYDTCLDRCLKRLGHPTVKDEKGARSALHTFFTKYERPTEDEADEVEFRYPEGDKPDAVICDLDGTLCNVDHRLHFVDRSEAKTFIGNGRPPKPDWKSFFDQMVNDELNQWCDTLLQNYIDNQEYQIVLCSGRPDDYRKITETWLNENDVGYVDLFMRRRSDFRRDDIVKEIILDFEILTRYNPVLFIDDRDQVVKMWRRRGYTCLQCQDGNF